MNPIEIFQWSPLGHFHAFCLVFDPLETTISYHNNRCSLCNGPELEQVDKIDVTEPVRSLLLCQLGVEPKIKQNKIYKLIVQILKMM